MARAYAGVLGSLGMAVTMARGAILGAGIEGTAMTAVVAMLALAVVGLVVGGVAEATVDRSVFDQLEKKVEEHTARQA